MENLLAFDETLLFCSFFVTDSFTVILPIIIIIIIIISPQKKIINVKNKPGNILSRPGQSPSPFNTLAAPIKNDHRKGYFSNYTLMLHNPQNPNRSLPLHLYI